MEEVKLGHLVGPFTEKQLDEKFGKNGWLFDKCFALPQGTAENPKVRVVDDCRRSGLNSAYTATNELELLDFDVFSLSPFCHSRCPRNRVGRPWGVPGWSFGWTCARSSQGAKQT